MIQGDYANTSYEKIDFNGKPLFIGLDVHKKSWSVTIVVDGIEHRTFTQPPDPEYLNSYLQRMFPGGAYHSTYEAVFVVMESIAG